MRQRTFGQQFVELVQSLDTVSDATYTRIRSHVKTYIKDLGFWFYEVQIDGQWTTRGKDRRVASLATWPEWTTHAVDNTPVYDDDGKFTGQTTCAYARDKKLWITASNGGLLSRRKNPDPSFTYLHGWDRVDELPDYWDYLDGATRTSIIVPLRTGRRVFGHLNLEHADVLSPSDSWKGEFDRLAEGIAMLHRLHDLKLDLVTRTERALDALGRAVTMRRLQISRQKIFIASSEAAADDVMNVLCATLEDDFKDSLQVVHWKDLAKPGSIDRTLLDAIATSPYGIVYFSEPSQEPGRFVDNPNTLFEAGMYCGLCSEPGGITTAWIPMREAKSPPCPADFRNELQLIVPRTGEGRLDTVAFRSLIIKRVKGMLEHGDFDVIQ